MLFKSPPEQLNPKQTFKDQLEAASDHNSADNIMNIDDLIEEFNNERAKSDNTLQQENDDTGELFYQNIQPAPKNRLGYERVSTRNTKKDPRT